MLRELGGARLELFIDARAGEQASLDVSGAWARWLATHRERLLHVSMLVASRFVQMSAQVVQRHADLHGVMRVYDDAGKFDAVFDHALANARR